MFVEIPVLYTRLPVHKVGRPRAFARLGCSLGELLFESPKLLPNADQTDDRCFTFKN